MQIRNNESRLDVLYHRHCSQSVRIFHTSRLTQMQAHTYTHKFGPYTHIHTYVHTYVCIKHNACVRSICYYSQSKEAA